MYKSFLKRIFDLILSSLLLLLLSPFIVIIGISVLLVMGWPVLFLQSRPGYKGRIFVIYKFKTMINLKGADGILLSDAQRLTGFGKFLRQTSLDELPELINVIKGDMSLVGPRPLLVQYLDRYSPDQFRRHDVRPGITGWAQIHGRNAISWKDKFALDLWYVDNRSFWLDIKIFFMTVYKVFKRDGINQPGQATAKEFMGKEDNG